MRDETTWVYNICSVHLFQRHPGFLGQIVSPISSRTVPLEKAVPIWHLGLKQYRKWYGHDTVSLTDTTATDTCFKPQLVTVYYQDSVFYHKIWSHISYFITKYFKYGPIFHISKYGPIFHHETHHTWHQFLLHPACESIQRISIPKNLTLELQDHFRCDPCNVVFCWKFVFLSVYLTQN